MADFSPGTADSGAFITALDDGDVTLLPSIRAEFTGTALPAAWTASLKKRGTAVLAGGLLTIDFATVSNTTIYKPGVAVEFVATFSGAVNQLAGFTSAQFITKSDGKLYARSVSTPMTETPLGTAYFGAPHRFRITWTTGRMQYEVDGTVVADHAWGSLPSQMPLQFADLMAVGGGSLVVDWVRVSPYAAAGTFTSPVFDAGEAVAWLGAEPTTTLPAGTKVVVSVRMGATPTPDGTWTAFAVVDASGAIEGSGRYAQYRVELSTTSPEVTPVLHQMVVTYQRR
jgi:hypothetical protein